MNTPTMKFSPVREWPAVGPIIRDRRAGRVLTGVIQRLAEHRSISFQADAMFDHTAALGLLDDLNGDVAAAITAGYEYCLPQAPGPTTFR